MFSDLIIGDLQMKIIKTNVDIVIIMIIIIMIIIIIMRGPQLAMSHLL